jgi:hypothetical protein
MKGCFCVGNQAVGNRTPEINCTKGEILPIDSLRSISEKLFGKKCSDYFCEIVAMALLGYGGEKTNLDFCRYDAKWFNDTYNAPYFDYVIGIARKGCSCFRSYLRTIKESVGDTPDSKAAFKAAATKPIILNSRTINFYNFKELKDKGKDIGDVRILILDDLLNKGRNISRILRDLLRMGIEAENVCYAALGFHMMQANQPKEGDCHSTWIEPSDDDKNRYVIRFDVEPGDRLYTKRIPLLLPQIFATENFLSSKDFFLDREEINTRSFRFNEFMHYAAVPYTGYMSSAYLRYTQEDDALVSYADRFEAAEKIKKLFEAEGRSLEIEALKKFGILLPLVNIA